MSRPLQRYDIPCTPPFWARGGHAQTLLGHVLPSRGRRIIEGERITRREVLLDDGDRLVAFQLPGSSGVRVHLFHGLSGDVNSEYMRRTANLLNRSGHEVWTVNHRGCGEQLGLATHPYHSGKTEDMRSVLAVSRADAPHLTHLVIGFSLSGNMALLHAAQALEPQPDGIIAVNPPADLERASIDLGRGSNRVYEMRFMWRLRRAVRERERAGLTNRHYEISLRMSLCEFDDLFTAPECGFDNGLDYYRRCSSIGRLEHVTTPAVIVTAGDDPFVDATVFHDARRSESVLVHVEPRGGHVGYLARRGLGWCRWLDGALLHYVEELARPNGRSPADESSNGPSKKPRREAKPDSSGLRTRLRDGGGGLLAVERGPATGG